MVLFTPEKLIFKGSKKQHQILAQTAYYQAGKIVVQTILPEQPPIALITLNTLGTTCSTSADTYIPIENIFNTQSCSSLESRLVSLYGGKAASLLIEYEQRLKFLNKNNNSSLNDSDSSFNGSSLTHNKSSIYSQLGSTKMNRLGYSGKPLQGFLRTRSKGYGAILFQRGQKLTKQKIDKRSQAGTETRLINNVARIPQRGKRSHVFNFSELTLLSNSAIRPHTLTRLSPVPFQGKAQLRGKEWQPNAKARLVKTCFAGAGNNIFQSTLGNIEVQTATRLARIMVNYWNFYSLNKISLYSLVKKYALAHNFFKVPVHKKTAINSINKLTNFSNSSFNDSSIPRATLYPLPFQGIQSKALQRVQQKAPEGSKGLGVPRTVTKEKILPYKSTICKASARLKLLRSSSKATRVPPAFYKSRNSLLTPEGYIEDLHRTNNWESKNFFGVPSKGIPYPATGKKFLTPYPYRVKGYANDANLRFAYPVPLAKRSFAWGKQIEEWGEQLKDQKQKDLSYILKEKSVAKKLEVEGDAKRQCNVRIWGIKLEVKDKTPQGNIIYKYKIAKLNSDYPSRVYKPRNNLYFAIAQSKNSLKICENKNSSYNIQRLSIENIGNYSQLNNNNFQLINSLQFSHLQRDRFYPNWFRLYLPDMEATEFLKNIANYYFSLGLQTLIFPSTKSNYFLPSNVAELRIKLLSYYEFVKGFPRTCIPLANRRFAYPEGVWGKETHLSGARGKLNVSSASPFLSFLNKNTQKKKYKLFIPNISSYTYCPPAILINSLSVKSINSRNKLTLSASYASPLDPVASLNFEYQRSVYPSHAALVRGVKSKALQRAFGERVAVTPYPERVKGLQSEALHGMQNKRSFSQRNTAERQSKARDIKDPSFTKGEGMRADPLTVPFSLLLESQIFPLNSNGFSIVEKELLYNTLVNSSFAKAFYLINQNRQLLDFFVDYLLRFQILRQHQILYLFSTLLLGCNKTA